MGMPDQITLISDTIRELPVTCKPGMRVPARIFATEKLIRAMAVDGP